MIKQDNKIFQFGDPRQERIYSKLQEIGPGPAAFFKDSCRMWDDEPPLESKTHLIAHLLREIESSVRDVMLPLDFKPIAGTKKTHKLEIQAILSLYEIDLNDDIAKLWLRLANKQEEIALHYLAHRNALERPRESGSTFEDLWNGMQALLDIVLGKMEAKYLGFIGVLDGLLAKTTITSNDIDTLKNKIPNSPVTYSYFFEKLDNPIWLIPLKEAGFFKNPPLPIIHPDSGTSFPNWPQAQYLKKMAQIKDQQKVVLAVCLEVKTENVRSRGELLDIALLLPTDMSMQILDNIDEIDSWFGPEKYGKLISYLSKEGKGIEALVLASKLLAIQPDPRESAEYGGHKIPHDPIGLIRDWDYEQILEKDFPLLVDATGFDAVKVLLDQLENYINFSNINRESGSKDDYSEIWRPAIEDHSQNHEHGIRDVLINGVRDASERLLKSKPDQIITLITELENRKLLIFRRMAFHLLRLFPKGAAEKIRQLLMNEEEFSDKQRLTHEYFLLAETHASLLSEAQRKKIWSWIMKGPDIKINKTRGKQSGVDPTDEQIQKYQKNWQMYHLMPFKDIDPEWQKYFKEIVSIVGEPEFPSFRSWSTGGTWGPNSSLSDEQFKKMKPSDVVEYLKTWKPPTNDPLDTSREGTSRELTAQIANNPEKWLESIASFKELDPTYVRSVFTGYRDAIRQGKEFDWSSILDLSEIVLSKPIEVLDRKPSGFFGDDPDWSWCRNAIVELITEGLKDNKGKIPVGLRKKAWFIVEVLTNDPDPTPKREEEYLTSHPDPLSLAINTTRGDAMDTAIQYGVWLKSDLDEKDQSKWSLEKDAPELLEVLNNHLDISKDPSVGIRALYGEKLGILTWLDEKWVQENHYLIFPVDPELQKYFDAAWEAYITFVHAYNNVFKILRPQYERAIKEIGRHTDAKHHLENPDQNLAHHLTIFYWRGLIELDNGLFADFYKVASMELKAEVIDFIGRVAKDDKEVPQEVKDKFVVLLESRIAKVKASENPQGSIQEFQSLSWWLASEKFDDEWILNKLLEIFELGCDLEGDHLVIERFVVIAPLFPTEVIKCSMLMVENDKKGWGILHWGEELKLVIETVFKSNNSDARIAATEFVHRLAARGHLDFKDLLHNINTTI